jgi:hypothetical protein
MTKDTCRHCGIDVERTEELSASAGKTGGFLCSGCLAGYRALYVVPAYGEHRGSRARMDDAVSVSPPGIPAEIEARIERYLGVRR